MAGYTSRTRNDFFWQHPLVSQEKRNSLDCVTRCCCWPVLLSVFSSPCYFDFWGETPVFRGREITMIISTKNGGWRPRDYYDGPCVCVILLQTVVKIRKYEDEPNQNVQSDFACTNKRKKKAFFRFDTSVLFLPSVQYVSMLWLMVFVLVSVCRIHCEEGKNTSFLVYIPENEALNAPLVFSKVPIEREK